MRHTSLTQSRWHNLVTVGPISYDIIQLFTTITDFVAFFYFNGYMVFVPAVSLMGVGPGRPVPAQYSFLKINGNNESLVWSRFESDKVNCLPLLPTVMHASQFFSWTKSIFFWTKSALFLKKDNSTAIKSHWFGSRFQIYFRKGVFWKVLSCFLWPCWVYDRPLLVVWLLISEQKRMGFKSIKYRLFCWMSDQEQKWRQ